MFEHEEEMEFRIRGLSVFGDIMLVLFVTLLVTTSVSVKSQLIENSPLGGAQGEEVPPIGLKVIVGPGKSILAGGKQVELEELLSLAEKGPETDQVQVQRDLAGDASLYFKVRYELRKCGRGFIEAPPQETSIQNGGGK
jgi:biopolymer transport protein ExbD